MTRLAFAVILGALTCAAGCGSTNTPGGGALADGGDDAGPDAGDGGNTGNPPDAGPGSDSGARDSGTSPDASSMGDGGAPPLALPTSIGPSSAASYGTTESYRLYLSAGAPQPYGDGRSSNYSLRLGVRPPE